MEKEQLFVLLQSLKKISTYVVLIYLVK
jgi:hypothetical protein